MAIILLFLATGLPSMGQAPAAVRARQTLPVGVASPSETGDITKFSLDFPGGTPGELVAAISMASGFQLNAIIPDEHANVRLPALRMTHVSAPRLFQALRMATTRIVTYPAGVYSMGNLGPRQTQYQQLHTYSSFETTDTSVDDSTVWYFTCPQPPPQMDLDPPPAPKTCRFFQLAPYLESYKVEDVTTAVQTAWKMLHEFQPPTLSYHEDTKLLIAVGDADKVKLIEDVLSQLSTVPPASPALDQPADGQDRNGKSDGGPQLPVQP
jgi:hypothetical protein